MLDCLSAVAEGWPTDEGMEGGQGSSGDWVSRTFEEAVASAHALEASPLVPFYGFWYRFRCAGG